MNQSKVLNKDVSKLLGSVLVTNIGNGIFTLVLGKHLYDITGEVYAFGLVFIIEHIISFLLQIFAGSFVDRNDSKKVCAYVDFMRGAILVAFGIFAYEKISILYITVFIIQFFKPFYRAGSFSLSGQIVPNNKQLKLSSYYVFCQQTGQLSGMAIGGFFIYSLGISNTLLINGASYIVAGISIALIKKNFNNESSKNIRSTFKKDWKEVYQILKNNTQIFHNMILVSIAFLVAIFLNLALVPIVDKFFNGDARILGILDMSWAVGAIIASALIAKVIEGKEMFYLKFTLLFQAICFFMLTLMSNLYAGIICIGILGALNMVSLTILITNLQQSTDKNVKGKISGVRHLISTVLSIAIIPVISYGHGISLSTGLIFFRSHLLCMFHFSKLVLQQKR